MNAIVGLGARMVMVARVAASMMFVVGPAMAVLPMIFLSMMPPLIMTAPGLMSFSGEIIETIVINAPQSVRRNSAHKP